MADVIGGFLILVMFWGLVIGAAIILLAYVVNAIFTLKQRRNESRPSTYQSTDSKKVIIPTVPPNHLETDNDTPSESKASESQPFDVTQQHDRVVEGASIRFRKKSVKLYHFTDQANVCSIQTCGRIYSRSELARQRISATYVSDDLSRSIDQRAGLDEYVHLSFHRAHKMSYAARSRSRNGLCIFEVDLSVLDRPGAKVMRGLANKSGLAWEDPGQFSDDDLTRIERGDEDTRYWQAIIPGSIDSESFAIDSHIRSYVRQEGPSW